MRTPHPGPLPQGERGHDTEIDALFHARWLWPMLLGVLALAVFRYFDHDEFQHVHTGWKVLREGRIYTDFFAHHHPFQHYLIAGLFTLTGDDAGILLAARLMTFLFLLGTLAGTYVIARDTFGPRAAGPAVALLTTMLLFVEKAIEIRPDVPQVCASTWAVALWLRFEATKSRRALVASALLSAVSFLFLQKAVFVFSLFGVAMLAGVAQKKWCLRTVVGYWTTFALAILPYYAYLAATGQLKQYILVCWTLNARVLAYVSPIPYFVHSFVDNAGLWLCFAAGLLTLARSWRPLFIAWMAIGLLLWTFGVKFAYPQYFMPALPFVAAIAGQGLLRLAALPRSILLVLLAGAAASPIAHFIWNVTRHPREHGHHDWYLALVIAPIVYACVCRLWRMRTDQAERGAQLAIAACALPPLLVLAWKSPDSGPQYAKVEYVLAAAAPDERVYDGDIRFNLCRRDVDYFWFGVEAMLKTYQALTPYEYDVYRAIETHRPRVISTFQIDMADPRIAEHYRPSEIDETIWVRERE